MGGYALIAALMLISAILVGCTAQDSGTQKQPLPSDNQSVLGNNSIITAENKTGFDKNQDAIALALADGTYTDNVTYTYHPTIPEKTGNETVTISITVKDGIITAASVEGNDPVPISKKIIDGVNAALPDLVVGKKITELNIPAQVAGSSLTTAAFKQYVGGLVATQ